MELSNMKKANIFDNYVQYFPLLEDMPIVELTNEQVEELESGKLIVVNGQLVDNNEKIIAEQRIQELKTLLNKYKEDVEQVELFGMERTDYEEKKKACADMIIELRQLEKGE